MIKVMFVFTFVALTGCAAVNQATEAANKATQTVNQASQTANKIAGINSPSSLVSAIPSNGTQVAFIQPTCTTEFTPPAAVLSSTQCAALRAQLSNGITPSLQDELTKARSRAIDYYYKNCSP